VPLERKTDKIATTAMAEIATNKQRCPVAIPKAAPSFKAITTYKKPSTIVNLLSGCRSNQLNTAVLLHKSRATPNTITDQKMTCALRPGSFIWAVRDEKARPTAGRAPFCSFLNSVTLKNLPKLLGLFPATCRYMEPFLL